MSVFEDFMSTLDLAPDDPDNPANKRTNVITQHNLDTEAGGGGTFVGGGGIFEGGSMGGSGPGPYNAGNDAEERGGGKG